VKYCELIEIKESNDSCDDIGCWVKTYVIVFGCGVISHHPGGAQPGRKIRSRWCIRNPMIVPKWWTTKTGVYFSEL
jgi:hypothetical protein